MKSKIFILIALCLLLVLILYSFCKKINLSDFQLTLSGPSSGHTGYLYTFSASFIHSSDDSFAIRFSWDDGDTSDWSLYVPSGDTITMKHSWSIADTYYVKAQVQNIKDNVTDWSSGHKILISANTPPNIPSIPTGPDSGYCNGPSTFFSSAIDLDGDSIAIRFDWGDEHTSEWSTFVSSGETVSMSYYYSSSNRYIVKAQAKDKCGAITNWSEGCQIFISPIGLVKWIFYIGCSVSSTPAIGLDGTIYFGCSDSRLYALNPDGSMKWRYSTGGGGSSPAIGSDGTIYVGSSGGKLYAINPDGSKKWSYSIGHEHTIKSSPAIDTDGTIYFGSIFPGYLYALNPDGTLKWLYPLGGNIRQSSPTIGSDGTIYVGSDDGKFNAINPDGTLKWQHSFYGENLSSAAIGSDGTIYYGTEEGNLYAFNPEGSLKWLYPTRHGCAFELGSPVIGTDNTIYFGVWDYDARGTNLYAVNPDGSLKWCLPIERGIWSAPLIGSDGTIYIGPRDKKHLVAINPDGTMKWSCPTGTVGSSPTLGADGTIYVGTINYVERYDGCLFAIQGSGTLANSPWPKFQHDLKNTGRVGGP